MPLYDYGCPACDSTREVYHRMAEKPKVRCLACKTKMAKRISMPAVFGDRLDWSGENGGRGRQIPMLQANTFDQRPETYARNAHEAVAKCRDQFPECHAAVARD